VRSSLDIATSEPTDRTTIITASRAQPWRTLPAMRPKVLVRPNGMIRISSISNQFRDRRGVLEGVRRVRVEEAAAVGAQLLDGLLRGDGTERDRLGGT